MHKTIGTKSYISKNANLFLLYWVAMLAVSLVAAGIYFQHQFEKLHTQLVEKSNKLEAQQRFLSYVTSELDVKNDRERRLLEKFEEVSKDNAQLTSSCSQMEQQLQQAGFVKEKFPHGKYSQAFASIFPRDDLGRSY